ncbi:MAG: hypothetical protein OER22_06925 [Gammaproteobacteria bacterium]|nr:hypothetical protein [Gammaproteobacteria bacterium]MDH3373322.1 hypothetical protein [Gammaproteobacteria bacterium]MDH3408161.1 hypothetical protein [Gammaproteobacteria bacterium]MDH3552331.1 hypothetical protein [Gammaproteobacteria bacterium]
MADLMDLKKSAEEVLPLIKDLFSRARGNQTKQDLSREIAVISRLQRLTAEAQDSTPASLEQRADAIVANHTSLTEILIEAAVSHFVVDEAELLAVRVEHTALGNSLGRLFERAAFEPITQLLDKDTVQQISDSLTKASADIAAKTEAKAILDNMIGIATTAAKIATKLA